jgi:hypothetical protein
VTPTLPARALPSRLRPLWLGFGLTAAVVIVVAVVAGTATDYLWFRALGAGGVFRVSYGVRWAMFGTTGSFMALATGLSAVLARRMRPALPAVFLQPGLGQPGLERWRLALDRRWGRLLAAVLAVVGVLSGLTGARSWATWLQFAHRTSFGQRDPQFHLDLSFFVFVYPFLRLVLTYAFVAVLLALAAAVVIHVLYGGLRFRPGDAQATAAARAHLFILLGMFVLLKAVAYWLDRYGIDFSSRDVITTGASYTDVNAVLPAKTVLAAIALLCALLFFAGAARRDAMLPAVGFCLLVLSAILVGGVYPAVIEQFVVKPNELAKESRYIQRDIGATRSAFGISGAKVTAYPVTPARAGTAPGAAGAAGAAAPATSARLLGAEVAALPDLRLTDPAVTAGSFQQLQQAKSFYRFGGVLDVDRYRVPGAGRTPQDMVIGVRDMTGPPPGEASWVNTHLVYTHGFGVVAAAAGSAQANGDPAFTESGIPPRGVLGSLQPRVYFGPQERAYAIVGAPAGRAPMEFDYPAAGTSAVRETTYRGGGGVPLGSMTDRLLYAIRFGDPSILLSSAVNRDSRLLYIRDPLARVAKVAPFLTLDGDVYPVVTGGQILWVADGYTTTDSYPYATRYDAAAATAGSAAPVGPGAGQINYIRNSVKAVVNAYTGQVTLYAWDARDPVLRTWMKAFPGLIRPRRAIPPALLAHLRYPTGLFDIQRQLLATYHVQTAAAFYGGQDVWAVPGNPAGAAPDSATPDRAPQPPAYLTMTMPGDPAPEFSLTTSFTPADRPSMAAYTAVDSNPASPGYGTIRILELPQNTAMAGPQQIQNAFESDPAVSAELTGARRAGARVIVGNLIALPVGTGFLYVEPLYVEAPAGAAGSFPALRKVLVSYGGTVGYGSTVQDALGQIFTGLAAPPGTGASGAAGAIVRADVAQAEWYFTAAQTALKSGDFTAYGRDVTGMKKALDEAQQAAAAR